MTLTVELTPEEEARLHDLAREAGIDANECARRLLIRHLTSASPGQATRELLRAWREEDATDDPNQILQAEEELTAFEDAMNATRAAAGARLLYP
jgi:hypothetical protein